MRVQKKSKIHVQNKFPSQDFRYTLPLKELDFNGITETSRVFDRFIPFPVLY